MAGRRLGTRDREEKKGKMERQEGEVKEEQGRGWNDKKKGGEVRIKGREVRDKREGQEGQDSGWKDGQEVARALREKRERASKGKREAGEGRTRSRGTKRKRWKRGLLPPTPFSSLLSLPSYFCQFLSAPLPQSFHFSSLPLVPSSALKEEERGRSKNRMDGEKEEGEEER